MAWLPGGLQRYARPSFAPTSRLGNLRRAGTGKWVDTSCLSGFALLARYVSIQPQSAVDSEVVDPVSEALPHPERQRRHKWAQTCVLAIMG